MLLKYKSSKYDNNYVNNWLFYSFNDAEKLCNEIYKHCEELLDEIISVYGITDVHNHRIKQLKDAQTNITTLKDAIINTKKASRSMYDEYAISMKAIFDCAITDRQLDLACKYDHEILIPTATDFNHETYRMYKFIMKYLKYKYLRKDAKTLLKYYKDLWKSSSSSLKYYLYRLKNIAQSANLDKMIRDKIDGKAY